MTCSTRVAITLLAIHAGLLAYSATRQSPTCDEIGHLAAGLSHWQTGRFDLYRVNPPLVRLVAAMPLLAMDVRTDSSVVAPPIERRPEFPAGAELIRQNSDRYGAMFKAARWACLPFSLIGGLVCWRWATRCYGTGAGIVALSLWCFCPNVLAHGPLITPDAAATSLGVAAGYSFWNWLRSPTWRVTFITGLLLGIAEFTKATWLIALPLWPAVTMFWVSQQPADEPKSWCSRSSKMLVILLLALYVLNAGYFFDGSFAKLGDYAFTSSLLRPSRPTATTLNNRFAGTWLGELPVPLPKDYVLGIDTQKSEFEGAFWSYCRGRWKRDGWHYYYLYALLLKVPIGILLSACIAGAVSIKWRRQVPGHAENANASEPAPMHLRELPITWRDEVVLLATPATVLIFVSSQTGINHHVRYVLPALPFVYIWMSRIARLAWPSRDTQQKPGRWLSRRAIACAIVSGTLISGAVSSLCVFPHSLSYFNEVIGGPQYGHLYLAGSNVDWGQDLWYLRSWYQRHSEARPLFLNYDVRWIDPLIEGIEYQAVPPGPVMNRPGFPKTRGWPWKDDEGAPAFEASRSVQAPPGPTPGWYVLSVNQIHELNGTFEYFQEFDVVERIGYSMNAYHLSAEDVDRIRRNSAR